MIFINIFGFLLFLSTSFYMAVFLRDCGELSKREIKIFKIFIILLVSLFACLADFSFNLISGDI